MKSCSSAFHLIVLWFGVQCSFPCPFPGLPPPPPSSSLRVTSVSRASCMRQCVLLPAAASACSKSTFHGKSKGQKSGTDGWFSEGVVHLQCRWGLLRSHCRWCACLSKERKNGRVISTFFIQYHLCQKKTS